MALREMSLRNIRPFLTLPASFSSRRNRKFSKDEQGKGNEHENEQTKQATHFQSGTSVIEHLIIHT